MESSKPSIHRGYKLYDNGIELWEIREGLLVRQSDEAYVAKDWRNNPNTDELVRTSLSCGFNWMIRNTHPNERNRWPDGEGTIYLAFSPTRTCQWAFAISSLSTTREDFSDTAFNGKYREQFDQANLEYKFRPRPTPHGDLMVKRDNVFETIKHISDFNHSVLNFATSRG